MSIDSARCAINHDAADEKSAPPPATPPKKETKEVENDAASRQTTSQSSSKSQNTAPDSPTFFDKAGKQLENYANEVSECLSEIQTRFKAYIGPIEEAEEHTVDNKFIVRGYRINHNTCGRLFKSLCTCHNEFVNVWSHFIGVLVFLVMITVVCINVLPNQFWYAKELDTDFNFYQAEGVGLSDPIYFIDTKIENLQTLSTEAQGMAVSTSDEVDDFEDSMTDIMYRIEGISHFAIEHFYTFEYMKDDQNLVDSTEQELLDYWYETFTGYNKKMLSQLTKSQLTMANAEATNSNVKLNKWVRKRVSTLHHRFQIPVFNV